MTRVRLAPRVPDLDAAVEFYATSFGAPVATRRPGYARFAVAEPPLELVLLQGEPGAATGPDHLGVEVGPAGEVAGDAARCDTGLKVRARA
jgi:catechol 2,3-dioxygenase-like lactoylglutathione lyase family enzyme